MWDKLLPLFVATLPVLITQGFQLIISLANRRKLHVVGKALNGILADRDAATSALAYSAGQVAPRIPRPGQG